MNNEQNHVDDYTIIKKLGYGASSTVKLAKNDTTGDIRALKLMNYCTQMETEAERNFFEKVSTHPNIVQYYGFKENVEYLRTKGRPSRRISYLDLEYVERGQIYDFISQLGAFPEPIARYYFH